MRATFEIDVFGGECVDVDVVVDVDVDVLKGS